MCISVAFRVNNFTDPSRYDLYDLCLEVVTVHGTELHLFGSKAFSLFILLMSGI